ncbi:MAG: Transposase [Candidatus Midichloria mitochondrii]|uniref:Uncharacterized protein n=1 Tax=Midichloria mitochondrii (strain IricVA) TaxID=696127 RepID=F7XW99_MIDMI|nr:hypothetical protein midi_00651 [Candidatus Midichloria mitochondrii IricVA]
MVKKADPTIDDPGMEFCIYDNLGIMTKRRKCSRLYKSLKIMQNY